jgi:hypothetical protein
MRFGSVFGGFVVAMTLVVGGVLGGSSALFAQDPAPNLTGAWSFSVVTDNGTGTPDVTLLQEDEALTGTYSSPRMGLRRLQGRVRGDSIFFTLETDPAAGVVMTFIGAVQIDGSLAGIVDFGGMGGASFTARRRATTPPPGAVTAGVIFLVHPGVKGVHASDSSALDPSGPRSHPCSLLAGPTLARPASLAGTTANCLHEGTGAGGPGGRTRT